jgi:2-(1,2-epoxy-1,2-dihydrophenyl)acetyl-CoA isomerase
MGETVLCEVSEGVATVTLNRPDALNAFNQALKEDLTATIKNCRQDDAVRAVIITGAGRAFCSGQDLKEVQARYAEGDAAFLGDTLRRHYHTFITEICTMDKPVIAAVNGVAAGAGCSLALACDLRIAAESAAFLQAFVQVGLVPDGGATFFLPRLVGPARAAEMCFTGEKVSAERAHKLGLINLVVSEAELMPYAANLAAKLASLPTKAIALTKQLLNRSFGRSFQEQFDAEIAAQETAARTDDHGEGLRAFLEKRKPNFTGQ